jgi:hypothetical protein
MTPATTPRRAAAPTVTLDPIAAKLATVGLDYPASCLPELVEEATGEQLSPLAFLDHLLTRQLQRKDERRVATMQALRAPAGQDARGLDWTFQACRPTRRLRPRGSGPALLQLRPPDHRRSRLPTLGPERSESLLPPRLHAVRARGHHAHLEQTVRHWPQIFAGDEILTTAILDRLLHRCRSFTSTGGATSCGTSTGLLSQPTDGASAPPTPEVDHPNSSDPSAGNLGVHPLRGFACTCTTAPGAPASGSPAACVLRERASTARPTSLQQRRHACHSSAM